MTLNNSELTLSHYFGQRYEFVNHPTFIQPRAFVSFYVKAGTFVLEERAARAYLLHFSVSKKKMGVSFGIIKNKLRGKRIGLKTEALNAGKKNFEKDQKQIID